MYGGVHSFQRPFKLEALTARLDGNLQTLTAGFPAAMLVREGKLTFSDVHWFVAQGARKCHLVLSLERRYASSSGDAALLLAITFS